MKNKTKSRIKIKSSFHYDKKIAKSFCKTDYYVAQQEYSKRQQYIDLEKKRLSTPSWERIDELIEYYKDLGNNTSSSTGKILLGIYNKNVRAACNDKIETNSNLLSVLSKPETLLLAYSSIKGNKGALTKAGEVSKDTYNNYTDLQKKLYLSSISFPDKITLQHFYTISYLLKKGQYTWGTSLRILIPKPGSKTKLRPLTIPPFMDRVVQKAITLILEAIYEPYFNKLNRSFGFRPNRGTNDAIIALTSTLTNGMRTAIEGDIEAAYDSVNKNKLIEILKKRIIDNKFLKLIGKRLNYEFVIKETNERETPNLGVPQGGIDSPYLWNIYMHEFDVFIHSELEKKINYLNSQLSSKRSFNRTFNSNRATRKRFFRDMVKTKAALKKYSLKPTLIKNVIAKLLAKTGVGRTKQINNLRKELFQTIRNVKRNTHLKNRISSATANKKDLRIFYIRYADDWILLTNGDKSIAEYLKLQISNFLKNELDLNLSLEKTIVTNITKKPAKFLGYEVKIAPRGAIKRDFIPGNFFKKYQTHNRSGLLVWVAPDRQRLINRFHMKGFCNKDGFPLTLPWMSTFEAPVIIQRMNAVIRGFANFYFPVIRNKSKIHRWVYILRYCCLKILAQKYKTSISKLFKKYGVDLYSKAAQTVAFTARQRYGQNWYEKTWKLLTYESLVKDYQKKLDQRRVMLKLFWDIEKGVFKNFPERNDPSVANENYLDTLSWTSWRTQAGFDMPCAYCGTFEKVQMHHIHHVKKRSYQLIPDAESYQKIMALRNRKQIPLCDVHHLQMVHGGKYDGPSLISLNPLVKPSTLVDNRIIHISSFVKPGMIYEAKSLEEKGWKKLQ